MKLLLSFLLSVFLLSLVVAQASSTTETDFFIEPETYASSTSPGDEDAFGSDSSMTVGILVVALIVLILYLLTRKKGSKSGSSSKKKSKKSSKKK